MRVSVIPWKQQVWVLNNMTEIRILDSKDRVMSNEEGNLEEQWRIGDKHKVARWGKKESKCDTMKAKVGNVNECEYWGTVTQNDTKEEKWL